VIVWANDFDETREAARGVPGLVTIRDILQLKR
jgi:hypothetical protein